VNRLHGRSGPLAVLVVAGVLLVASLVWVADHGTRSVTGPMRGFVDRGEGPVRDLGSAVTVAERFGERWELHVGEVMRFDSGFYAELVDGDGHGATEVLVDADSGAAHVEWGPAMMWNTVYGMHAVRRNAPADVDGRQARHLAEGWLRAHRPAERAGEVEPFPGYYTVHTLRGQRVAGMLSVHAGTGAVWYHDWHGGFLDMWEADPPR
jgi:hypothetical protein